MAAYKKTGQLCASIAAVNIITIGFIVTQCDTCLEHKFNENKCLVFLSLLILFISVIINCFTFYNLIKYSTSLSNAYYNAENLDNNTIKQFEQCNKLINLLKTLLILSFVLSMFATVILSYILLK